MQHLWTDGTGVGFEQAGNEGIGVLRRQRMGRQPVSRKIPQIAGHDHVCAAVDGRRQNMAVVGVRQVGPGGNCLVARHDGIGDVFVHDRAGPVQHGGVDIGTVGQEVGHPLAMDVGAPERGKEIAVGGTQQQVAKTGRIKHVGIQQRRRAGHLLLQAELLVACGQFVERLAAAQLGLSAPGENVLGADSAVRADLAAGDPARVEELDQMCA